MKSLLHVLVITALGGILLLSTGCETAKGLGRDIEGAGEELQEAAD